MIVRLVGAGVRCSTKRRILHRLVLRNAVAMGVPAVDQLAVLEAAAVLDQKHMAAARALQD